MVIVPFVFIGLSIRTSSNGSMLIPAEPAVTTLPKMALPVVPVTFRPPAPSSVMAPATLTVPALVTLRDLSVASSSAPLKVVSPP